MMILTKCPMCGEKKEIFTPSKNYIDWKNGALVQNTHSYLSSDDRERMITGFCPICFEIIFCEEVTQ